MVEANLVHPAVDEMTLDMVGLSWLTCLFNVAWRSGTTLVEWQTGVVFPDFKKKDWRVCFNYRGITLLSLLPSVGEEAPTSCRTSDSGGAVWFSPRS